jgi:hypothetical protein
MMPMVGLTTNGLNSGFELSIFKMKKKYTGRCHCGKIRFAFSSEEIKEGRRCNCSLCIRRGAVVSAHYILAKDFQPHPNTEDFAVYQWNDRVIEGLFCKNCGIFPYFGNEEWGYRVNLGCVEQLDALALDVSILDGRSIPIAENPGPHPGDH